MFLSLLVVAAQGAEVVWLEPPTDAWRASVAALAKASGPALSPVDLRAAATRWTAADDEALRRVDAALAQARTYETQLDGELLILRDLEGPVTAVSALRDPADRGRLFAALAYQGFAANRYFGDQLGTDEAAAPWRSEVNGQPLERPWLDAIALAPSREATAYEIAEAPQRVAYNALRGRVTQALPATVTPRELPGGASLRVDGSPAAPDVSGNLKVTPGRHLVQVEQDGHILARFDATLRSGDDLVVALSPSESAWTSFLATVDDGMPIPAEIRPLVEALGGEVWVARPDGGGGAPTVLSLSALGVRQVPLTPVQAPSAEPSPDASAGRGGLAWGGSVGLAAGWLSSGDFYAQDPANAPHAVATVNAAAVGGFAEGHLAVGLLRAGAGVDLLATPGPWHVALTGDTSTRFRPLTQVFVGLPFAVVTAGWLFPY
ncbi:MAG: hypothetical protein H6738_14360, partial [Alphaproteobacteria bacterium]|nr:hypothetical protein [Alphaproteobacteria bacterium]